MRPGRLFFTMPRMNASGQQYNRHKLQFQRSFYIHLLVLCVVAAALRWGYLSGTHLQLQYPVVNFVDKQATSALMIGDAALYFKEAKTFLSTGSLGLPYRPPGTAMLLAGAMAIGSPTIRTAHIWQILIGALIPVFFAVLACHWFNRRIAVITGWLTATAFPMIILSGTLCSEIHLLFLLGAALVLLESERPATGAAAGVLLGFALLTRAETALFIGLLLIYEFVSRRHSLRYRTLLVFLLFLPVLAWSIRNYIVIDNMNPNAPAAQKRVIISANGPLNFYLGNGPMASGGYRSFNVEGSDQATAATIDFSDPIEAGAFYRGYQRAWDHLYFHPDQIAPLIRRKLVYFSRGLHWGIGLNNVPLGTRGVMRRGDMWTSESAITFYILSLGWLLGVIVTPKQHRRGFLISLFYIIATVLISIVFFGLARNAATMLPFLFIGLAVFLDWFFAKILKFILKPVPEILKPVPKKVPEKSVPKTSSKLPGYATLMVVTFFFGWQALDQSLNPVTFTSTNAIFAEMKTSGDDTYTRQDLIREYEYALERVEKADRIIVFEESMSTFLVGLAYAVNGDDPDRVDRLIDSALALDLSNGEAWKLKGIRAVKDPETKTEGIRALERYLQVNPRAGDAEMIREGVTRMKYEF